ncbi:GAF domain-containing SpoIIE family protein phosphatase [Micromonospora carbonacea]|uniref:SpoIIE family protein phosphatase n=1 Tax=Micromonospora carbonacea TaxID=47853 RepID=A0A7H8XPA7_9ACTN|nr:GAF domain-containing SpoIIE family protein phosphatase [Micromonospora carbonacea]MBB5825324.1 GAF domain-containing protein [Micromonospora carbonacea]QLD26604.1 SpoIIE family protein phosphatase [Micromonospora carbonacea]
MAKAPGAASGGRGGTTSPPAGPPPDDAQRADDAPGPPVRRRRQPAQRRADDAHWRAVFAAAGETGVRVARHDWAATPLGPVHAWPQSLRTAVASCLRSPVPVLLCWGGDLVVLHNDACLPLLGDAGPTALGRPGAEVWPGCWDVLGPVLRDVLAGATVTRSARWSPPGGDGPAGGRRPTFAHSPVIDESGTPGGVLTAVTVSPRAPTAPDTAGPSRAADAPATAEPPAGGGVSGVGGRPVPSPRPAGSAPRADAPAAREVDDRRRALRQAEAFARLAGALSFARGRAGIVDVVCRTAPALLGAGALRVATADPGAVVLEVAGDGGPGRLDLAADDPLARAVRHNVPVVVAATRDGDGGTALPLRYADGGALGAVDVRWAHPVAADEEPRTLLDAVAGLVSQALQRAELTGSAQLMADFAARLSATRSTTEAIGVVLAGAPAVLGARLPGLAVPGQGRRLRLWAGGDVPAGLLAAYDEMTVDDPRPLATALRTGERVVIHDRAEFADRFPEGTDTAGAHGMVTTVALPLFDAQRRPIAALGFGWPRRRPLRESDLALLDTVADLCEQTLERTRLAAAEHDLVTRLAGRLRTSARTAPPTLDVATRYRPAVSGMHLGGDWFDLIRLDGDRLAVVVGDVVGHQVEAAADMAQLRTIVNTLIRLGVPLGEVFPRLTDLIGAGFLGTCVAMVVDPAAGEAAVARVGHPHPVLARPGGAPTPIETAASLPLGMVREPVAVTTVPFRPGDLLVAYTDGLVERRGRTYDAGLAELCGVVDAVRDAPVEAVADALLGRLAGAEDDQALVVLRHVDPAARSPTPFPPQ